MKKIEEYHHGNLKGLIEIVARVVANQPNIVNDLNVLHTSMAVNIPGYDDRSKCFNCGRSMKITVYTADLLDALLILAMARQVKENQKRLPFTEANKVHIPTLQATQGVLKRQTKCDYLGLIKQPENWRGSGYWLLTGWAWQAMRGEEIPKSVKYWEGHLIGRSDETTTLSKMFQTHTDLVEHAIMKSKAIAADHRAKYTDYNPSDWASFGGYINNQNES